MSRPRTTSLWASVLTLIVAAGACSGGAGVSSPPSTPSTPARSPVPAAVATPEEQGPPASPTLLHPTLLPTPVPTATPRPAPQEWKLDLYNARGLRMQNPDYTACTAASALTMLNMAASWTDYTPAAPGLPVPRPPQGWKVDVSYTRLESMLAYQRKNGTMLLTWPGADAHGWRTSLNFYGWGSTGADVYHDVAFNSFEKAAMATVRAVALYRKPVGILGWAGDHAQIVTGYRVFGDDPRTGSTDFTITGIYLTDPLAADGYRDTYVTLATWKSGAKHVKFTPYAMTNSPYVDKVDGKQGNAEWDGNWVIVAPVA